MDEQPPQTKTSNQVVVGEPPPEPAVKDVIAVSVACVALTGFGVFILALLFQLNLTEVYWARATFLLNGVEAIAFAAAGYLFGREVHRGQAEIAKDLAKETQSKGQALANEVRRVYNRSALNSFGTSDQPLEGLRHLADQLFPTRTPEAPK